MSFDIIQDIITKAQNGNVAVFKIDGKMKIVPVAQKKRMDSMINDYFLEFKGIFNKDCPVKVLKENLS